MSYVDDILDGGPLDAYTKGVDNLQVNKLRDLFSKHSIPGGAIILKVIGILLGVIAIVFIIKWLSETLLGVFNPGNILGKMGSGIASLFKIGKHFPNISDPAFPDPSKIHASFPDSHLNAEIKGLFDKIDSGKTSIFDTFNVGEHKYNMSKESMTNMTAFFRHKVSKGEDMTIDGAKKKLTSVHINHIKEHTKKTIHHRRKHLHDAWKSVS